MNRNELISKLQNVMHLGFFGKKIFASRDATKEDVQALLLAIFPIIATYNRNLIHLMYSLERWSKNDNGENGDKYEQFLQIALELNNCYTTLHAPGFTYKLLIPLGIKVGLTEEQMMTSYKEFASGTITSAPGSPVVTGTIDQMIFVARFDGHHTNQFEPILALACIIAYETFMPWCLELLKDSIQSAGITLENNDELIYISTYRKGAGIDLKRLTGLHLLDWEEMHHTLLSYIQMLSGAWHGHIKKALAKETA